MSDYLLRGISADKQVRFFAVNAKGTVQSAIDIHYLSIVNSVAMGRLLLSGLLMSGGLKNPDDLLTLRIDGDGTAGTMLVTATGEHTIKGYVQYPQVELALVNGQFDVPKAIGDGTLSVIKSIGEHPPYTGQIALVSGEIGDDISHYFRQSEQIDSLVNLGILIEPDAVIRQAGGVLVQCLPDTSDDMMRALNENYEKMPHLSDLLDMGFTLEEVLEKHIFKNIPLEILDKKPVAYKCNCNRDKFYRGLKLLGVYEIQSMIDEGKDIETECHFCGNKYGFSVGELQSMLAQC